MTVTGAANISSDLTVGGTPPSVTWVDMTNTSLDVNGNVYIDGELTFSSNGKIKVMDTFIISRSGTSDTTTPDELNAYAYFSILDHKKINIGAGDSVNILHSVFGDDNASTATVGTIGLTVDVSGTDITGDLTVGGNTEVGGSLTCNRSYNAGSDDILLNAVKTDMNQTENILAEFRLGDYGNNSSKAALVNIRSSGQDSDAVIQFGTPHSQYGSSEPTDGFKGAIVFEGVNDHSKNKFHVCLDDTDSNDTGNNAYDSGITNSKMSIDYDGNMVVQNNVTYGDMLKCTKTTTSTSINRLLVHGENYGFGIDGSTLTYQSNGGHHRFSYGGSTTSAGTIGMDLDDNNLTVENNIHAKGDLGIGTTSPSYPLHIDSTVTDSSVELYMIGNTANDTGDYNGDLKSGQDAGGGTGQSVVFWYKENTIQDLDENDDGGMIWRWNDTTIPISVYATGAFVSGQTFATTSDRRIKTNIVDISDDEALVQFRKLQPKKYNYIDFKKKTTQQVYGFIAQEIAQEIPNSTTQTSDFIPDLYCYGEVDVCNNTIKLLQKSIIIDSSNQNIVMRDVSLNVDLSLNDTLKCCDASNNEFEIEISNIEIVDTEYILTIDASNIELSKHSYHNIGDASGNILLNKLVFIYGKKVDDLHHVKKDSIWTVAAAALQEVDRQQQADKVRISELETEVTTLKNQVSTFETQMSELLARVSSLETNNSTTTDGS